MKPTYKMPFRRRREGRTDYMNRLRMLKSSRPRLVVRKSLKYMLAQIVKFDKIGDKTLVTANSKELRKMGWKFACDNMPAAYLTGLIVAKKALKKDIKESILDSGLYNSIKGSKIYTLVKGAVDAGLSIPVDEAMFPTEERIKGGHIQKFKDLPAEFEKTKKKILGE